MAGIKRPEDFDVWKLAWELKRRVFAFTAAAPASSDRRYCDDIRRAARSGPDLVAEGYYRFNPREFHRFLNDSKASIGEVRNQLLHAKDERLLPDGEFLDMMSLADRAIGAATALQAYLRTCSKKGEHIRPGDRQRAKKESTAHEQKVERICRRSRVDRSTLHRF
jgi:four helix bundle protein